MLWSLSAFCASGTSVHFTSNSSLAVDTQEHHDVRAPHHRVANDVLSGRQLNRSHLNRRNERDTTHPVNPHAASSSHGNRAQRYDDPGKCLIFQETHKFFLGNAFRFNSSWSVGRRVPSEYVLHPIRVSGRTGTVQFGANTQTERFERFKRRDISRAPSQTRPLREDDEARCGRARCRREGNPRRRRIPTGARAWAGIRSCSS